MKDNDYFPAHVFTIWSWRKQAKKSLAPATITVRNIQPCMQSCDNLGFICFVCVDVSHRRHSWIKHIEHFNSCIGVKGGITALGGPVIAHLEGQVNKTDYSQQEDCDAVKVPHLTKISSRRAAERVQYAEAECVHRIHVDMRPNWL